MLLAIDENKSHYGYIKNFTKERIKTKSIFERGVYSPLKIKIYCTINGAQSVRFEKVTVEFKNYFKQIPVPFKVYAHFECNLGSAESYEGSYSKKKITFIAFFLTNLFVLMKIFTKPIVVFRGRNTDFKFIETNLRRYEYC